MLKMIRLVLLAMIALLIPSVALAAEEVPGITGVDVAQGAGVLATIIAIAGVASRLLSKAAPLHFWLPARAKWVPDALAAFLGVLLVGLPQVSTLIGQVEVGLMAVLMGAIAAAPGHTAPEDATASAPTKAGTVLLVLLLGGLLGSGCAWLRQNPEVIDGAMLAADNSDLICAQLPRAKDRAECLKAAELVKLGAKLAESALQRELEGQACPVVSAASAEPSPMPASSGSAP